MRPLVALTLRGAACACKFVPHVLLLYDPTERKSLRGQLCRKGRPLC
jgi:hypothetical protein